MQTSKATGSTTPTATPSMDIRSVVFTTGSSVTINASATVVFDAILDFRRYHEWNSWTPSLSFTDADNNATDQIQAGVCGILETRSEGQSNGLKIPIEILEVARGHHENKLAWKSKYLPWWAATIERVQVVTPKGRDNCEVRNWESMGGIAAYALKLGGVPKQLEEANVKYLDELAAFVEKALSDKY